MSFVINRDVQMKSIDHCQSSGRKRKCKVETSFFIIIIKRNNQAKIIKYHHFFSNMSIIRDFELLWQRGKIAESPVYQLVLYFLFRTCVSDTKYFKIVYLHFVKSE